jgi:hypothetical protein
LHKHLCVADRIVGIGIAAGVDSDNYCLCAEAAADCVDQHWIREGSGVDADFVCASFEDLRRIVSCADTATDAKWDEEFARGAANGVKQGGAALMGRSDVEQHDFIGAFAGVPRGLRDWVSSVD